MIAHEAVSRRPPIALYTPRTFGNCPSSKDHFLSPRAKPQRYVRNLSIAVRRSTLLALPLPRPPSVPLPLTPVLRAPPLLLPLALPP
jgi:hypothetical protein